MAPRSCGSSEEKISPRRQPWPVSEAPYRIPSPSAAIGRVRSSRAKTSSSSRCGPKAKDPSVVARGIARPSQPNQFTVVSNLRRSASHQTLAGVLTSKERSMTAKEQAQTQYELNVPEVKVGQIWALQANQVITGY